MKWVRVVSHDGVRQLRELLTVRVHIVRFSRHRAPPLAQHDRRGDESAERGVRSRAAGSTKREPGLGAVLDALRLLLDRFSKAVDRIFHEFREMVA